LGTFEEITPRDIRRAQRATLHASFMYGCVLESAIWGGCVVPTLEIVEQLELEARARGVAATALRTDARRNRVWAKVVPSRANRAI
jgi:hypothetical protein